VSYELKYRAPGPVAAAFLKSRPAGDALSDTLPIDCILGPIGSGKSAASCIRIFLHASEQPPGKDGWRRSRWAVVRNTYDELKRTTMATWLDWFPESVFGPVNWTPPFKHVLRLPEQKIELEVWFVPIDNAEAVKKVLSWELTGAWVNEGRQIPREVVVALRSRCGRYPSVRSLPPGQAPGWSGVILDSNAPEDELHYLLMWAGVTEPPEWLDEATRRQMHKPPGVKVFMQPPGLLPVRGPGGAVTGFVDNAHAENLPNLRPGYYRAQLDGNTSAWVLNMVCVEPRRASDTRLVYPGFRRELHVSPAPLGYDRTKPLLLGADFARNPSVVAAQDHNGQLRVLREWIGQNVDVASFCANKVVPELNTLFPDAKIRGWGDPAGSARTGGDDKTAFDHAREGGLQLVPCWTNDPDQRQRAVTRLLERMADGAPALVLDPRCSMLAGGFNGGYRFERKKVDGTVDEYHEAPAKNAYSHPHDALQYLCAGLGRGSMAGDAERRRQAAETRLPNGRVKVDPLALARQARRFGGGAGR
jgi:hypothetical protein